MRRWMYFDRAYVLDELKRCFRSQNLLNDVFAGIVVALVAIPLSLAIAMASSVPLAAGLISAVIGGVVLVVFGGTRLGITGPAIAMSVLVAECVQTSGFSGLLIIGVICGILQIVSGSLRLGWMIKLIPIPVISAFIAAIGFLIFVDQLPRIFQIVHPGHMHVFASIVYFIQHIQVMHAPALMLAVLTVAILAGMAYFFPKMPALLFAVAIPTILVQLLHLHGVALIGNIPHTLRLPAEPDFSQINWASLIVDGITLFILGSLEALLAITTIDGLTKQQSKPNQELIGQGIANILAVISGGIPVTGVIARSSVNVHSGAKTRRAALVQVVAIIFIVYLFPKMIAVMPKSVLAGILLAAAVRMINLHKLVVFWAHDKLEAMTYIVTFVAIISTNLVVGVEVGVLLTFIIVAIRLLAAKVSIKNSSDGEVIRISLGGNMTFWSFDKLNDLKEQILEQQTLKFVVFEFDNLSGIDSTGAKHLIDIAREIQQHNVQVIFHGITFAQQKLLSAQSDDLSDSMPYIATVTENEIKILLENSGVHYAANDLLKHGMTKFRDNYASERQELIDALAKAQNPHTLLITCSDSRLDPNAFLSVRLGELFIVRNVGNVVPQYSAGNQYSECAAIEFALGVLGIRNVVICAHTECGAIKASIKDVAHSSNSGLDKWLQIIKDGFKQKMPHSVSEGVEFNLLNQVAHLKSYPMVQNLLRDGALTIAAWVYDVHSAHMLEYAGNKFIPI